MTTLDHNIASCVGKGHVRTATYDIRRYIFDESGVELAKRDPKMKHQQVLVDYWTMLKTSGLCLLLAFCGFILLKMVLTVFRLPGHLKQNQQRLEELARQYAKEIGDDEQAEMEKLFNSNEPLTEERINQLLDKPTDAVEPKKDQ